MFARDVLALIEEVERWKSRALVRSDAAPQLVERAEKAEADRDALRSALEQHAHHLTLITDDLRANGDIPLVALSTDGVSRAGNLSDEIGAIAFTLAALSAKEQPR